MTDDDLAKRILYRDALMLILDKPAGLPVHKGPKGGETLEDHFDALRFGLPKPPRLAHRLDKDTSGCLILGRHAEALRRLGKLFESGRVEKVYWAVAAGRPADDEGRIDLPLAKRSPDRGWWVKPDPDGDPAVTDYKVLAAADGLSWIEARPLTGRTHQIRAHLAAIGCAILGDPIYGAGEAKRDGSVALHLHARAVAAPLYPKRPPVAANAPAPEHMQEALEKLGAMKASM